MATTYLSDQGIDNKLRQTSSTTGVSYFLTDHLGSTAALTDTTGNVVEQETYDSFANSAGSTRTRYGYTGRELDPDTGLLYYRARFYDPQVGRFISEDPLGFSGGINSYAYVDNSPLRFTDPSGLCTQKKGEETKECADMRARLLGDPFTHAALDAAWDRSQATSQHPKREEGGLLGHVSATGSYVDSVFTRQGNATAALEGFPLWANRKIRANRGIATYEFWYHSHPHDQGEKVPEGGEAGNPDFPSQGYDTNVSENLGLLGIIVSKKHIIVFDKDGFTKCSFDR